MRPHAKQWVLFFVLLGFAGISFAAAPGNQPSSPDVIALPGISFSRLDLEVTRRDGFDDVVLRRAVLQQPEDRLGHPLLPTLKLDVLIPHDKKISGVRVVASDSVHVPGSYVPRPIQRSREMDGTTPPPVPPDPEIYESSVPYPSVLGEVMLNGAMRGYRLGTVVIHPMQYVGASERLILYRSVTVEVDLSPLSGDEQSGMVVRSSLRDRNTREATEIDWLKALVQNPDDFERLYRGEGVPEELGSRTPFGGFDPTEFPSTDGPPVQYVIITDSTTVDGRNVGNLVSAFQRLCDWKIEKGTPGVVRTLTWIRSNYSGIDDPAKMRNFLIDAYRLWGTDYVLLGGDIHIVPARRFQTLAFTPGDPPAEVYFGGLDNDWDADNDGLFGEAENGSDNTASDPFWDVWVGRAPVESLAEAEEFVTRTLTYARAPSQDVTSIPLTYYDKALLMAGLTNSPAWNNDANGLFIAESLARYLTGKGINVQRHYQELSNSSPSCNYNKTYLETQPQSFYWSTSRVIDSLNTGCGIVFHHEHSNPYAEGGATRGGANCDTGVGGEIGREDVDRLTNKPKWSVVISTGSGVNAFDYESVSEHWQANTTGGGVAYIGKTRSETGDVTGEVDTLTFHNIFDLKMPLGQALAKATESTTGTTRRVVSSYALLGDPDLRAWTAKPDTLDVTVSPSSFSLGEQAITVTVKDLGTQVAIQGARVALKQTDRIYGFDLTDSQGKHVFDVNMPVGDTAYVVVTAPNYTPLKRAVAKSGSVKYVVYKTHAAADDSSLANNNGTVDAGEVIKLTLEVQNVGSVAAGGVTGKLYATGPLRFGTTVDGTYKPTKLWIGAGDQHPADLVTDSTFAYPDFHGVDFKGRSAKYDTSTAGGLFIWREKNLWNVVARGDPTAFIPGSVTYRGSIVTKGGLSDTTKSIDMGDVVHFATADSVFFQLEADTGSPADQDKFSFVAKEVNWLTVVDSTNAFGHLEPNATAQNRFTVRMLNAIEDRHEPVFELATKDSLNNDVGASQFAIPVAAPIPTYLRQSTADNSQADCGYTYCRKLAATLRNRGSGVADSIRTTLSLTAGSSTIDDNLIIFDRILGLDENTGGPLGTDVFTFGTNDTAAVRFSVAITNIFPDGTSRTWSKTGIDVVKPGTPTGVTVEPHHGRSLTVRWLAPASGANLAGYNIYRRFSGAGSFPSSPTISAPFDSTRAFQDVLLTADTTYVYAVAAQDSSGNESALSTAFQNDTWVAEHTGWPKLLDAGTPSSALAVNLDGDDELEIIALGNSVYAWNADGTPVIGGNSDGLFFAPGSGSTIHKGATGRFWSSPAVGDLDGDGNVEVVVSAWGDSLWVLSNTGQRKWGKFPRALWSSPALGDVNGDDSLEVVIVSGEVDSVYAWKHNGIGLLGPSGAFARLPDGSLFNYSTAALANVDTTAGAEVFYGSFNGNVYAFKGNGSLLWSTDVNGSAAFPLSTPAIGNICGCGSEFELVVTEGKDGNSGNNGLHNLNARNGAINQSWLSSDITGTVSTDGGWIHPPSLANLDGDSELEIVLATSGTGLPTRQARVLAFDHFKFCSGARMAGVDTLPQPYEPQISFGISVENAQPVIANLDQDDKYEIAVGADNFGLYLWEETFIACPGDSCATCLASSCDAERGWPVLYYGEVNGTPWVGDLDDDGFFEMVTRTQDGYVHVFDIPGTYASGDVAWGQFAHDSHHTSLYGYTGGSFQGGGSEDGAEVATEVLQNFPNPFNPSTTIGYTLGARAHVNLKVYSVTGRVVATLVDQMEEAGQHRVQWDGRGDDGRPIASGMYLYRFEAGTMVETRKLLMVR